MKNGLLTLRDLLLGIYSRENLQTTCCRQCGCCRVAMPQIKYSEALNIVNKIWNEWSREDKRALLVTCIRYFFSRSLIKPCPILAGNECRIYEDRPLSCRIYGLWPQEVWGKRVKRFEASLDLPVEKIPLNTQCPMVKRKVVECRWCKGLGHLIDPTDHKSEVKCPDCDGTGKDGLKPLTGDQIQKLYDSLDELDVKIGELPEEKIKKGWNTRTLHDWLLYRFFGEETLIKMTKILLGNDEKTIEAYLIVLEKVVEEQI